MKKIILSLLLLGLCFTQSSFAQKKDNTNPMGWVEGLSYRYFPYGTCVSNSERECISKETYEQACKLAKNTTQGFNKDIARELYSSMNEWKSEIYKGGSRESSKIIWINNQCVVREEMSGLYQGTSKRLTATSVVTDFIYATPKILVHSGYAIY